MHIRVWYERKDGNARPSRHGIWIRVDNVEAVVGAMKKALVEFEWESANEGDAAGDSSK